MKGWPAYRQWLEAPVLAVLLAALLILSLPGTLVLLWTDGLVYLLLATVLWLGWRARQREHLRAPWRRVLFSRRGLVAIMVLMAYVGVALLDSVHFRAVPNSAAGHGGEVVSVLDVALGTLRSSDEKTYSAPLATHLYALETVELADGTQVRARPRLVHGGAHLADPRWRARDIAWRASAGALAGLGVWLLLGLALACAREHRGPVLAALRDMLRGPTELPWRAALATAAVMLAGVGAVAALAPWYHLLGTDKVGQDVLYQSLKSVRTGLLIGTLTTLVMLPFALSLGVAAGYFRGWVDDVVQYVYTTLSSIPGVLLIAAAVLILQVQMDLHPERFQDAAVRADLRLLFLCLILGVTSWTTLCRLLRGEALKLREVDYVQAAQALGVGHARIIARHILPNVMHIVLITVALDFSSLVLAEAVLSYVGVGVDPSMNSWGNMINRARLELAREPVVWWSLSAAFVFMFTLVLAANLFADSVRDAFDPRLRSRH